MISPLPVGTIPSELLAAILARAPIDDPRMILGPGIGLDCAVVHWTARASPAPTSALWWMGLPPSGEERQRVLNVGRGPRWMESQKHFC